MRSSPDPAPSSPDPLTELHSGGPTRALREKLTKAGSVDVGDESGDTRRIRLLRRRIRLL